MVNFSWGTVIPFTLLKSGLSRYRRNPIFVSCPPLPSFFPPQPPRQPCPPLGLSIFLTAASLAPISPPFLATLICLSSRTQTKRYWWESPCWRSFFSCLVPFRPTPCKRFDFFTPTSAEKSVRSLLGAHTLLFGPLFFSMGTMCGLLFLASVHTFSRHALSQSCF